MPEISGSLSRFPASCRQAAGELSLSLGRHTFRPRTRFAEGRASGRCRSGVRRPLPESGSGSRRGPGRRIRRGTTPDGPPAARPPAGAAHTPGGGFSFHVGHRGAPGGTGCTGGAGVGRLMQVAPHRAVAPARGHQSVARPARAAQGCPGARPQPPRSRFPPESIVAPRGRHPRFRRAQPGPPLGFRGPAAGA